MARTLRFLCLSDLRGDFDLLRAAIASTNELRAHAIFVLGNSVGPLLAEADHQDLAAARLVLMREYDQNRALYRRRGILSLWDLAGNLSLEIGGFAPEVHKAARSIDRLLGARNRLGRVVSSGVALGKARAFYQTFSQILGTAHVPAYAMADTCLFEEHVPERHWLHYATFFLEGYSISSLGAVELTDPDAVAELAAGPRRKGQTVRLSESAFWKSDILLAYDVGPDLHEFLGATRDRLVVLSRPAPGYDQHTVAGMESGRPALFHVEERKVMRTTYRSQNGRLAPDSSDGTEKSASTLLRRKRQREELETSIRIAGLGRDLLALFDLLRTRCPELADRLDRTDNRGQILLEYLDHLEEDRKRLVDLLTAERAGLERIVHRLLPSVPQDLFAQRNTVAEVDAANLAIADLLSCGERGSRSGEADAGPSRTTKGDDAAVRAR